MRKVCQCGEKSVFQSNAKMLRKLCKNISGINFHLQTLWRSRSKPCEGDKYFVFSSSNGFYIFLDLISIKGQNVYGVVWGSWGHFIGPDPIESPPKRVGVVFQGKECNSTLWVKEWYSRSGWNFLDVTLSHPLAEQFYHTPYFTFSHLTTISEWILF